MPAHPQPVDPALISLLAFWADAGVDVVALDAPFDRLEAGAHRRQAPPRAPPRPAAPAPSAVPIQSVSAASDDAPHRALAAAAAAGDLAELQRAVEAFDFGRLGRGAAVFARGPERPQVIVLGDEPCADDEGAPFTGRAGGLLDRMMAAAGLQGQIWATNTIFWRSGGDRALAAQRQAACRPFLERALVLARPRALLLLGGEAAAWAGLGEGILKARGRWIEWGGAEGVVFPAIATFHPGFLLDHAEAKKRAWGDLLSLTARIAGL